MTAANTGIKTVDIGSPMLGMHSIRETGGVIDAFHYEKLFAGFFREFEQINHDLLKNWYKFKILSEISLLDIR